jgi:hypothetical protein
MLDHAPPGLATVRLQCGLAMWPIDSTYQEQHSITLLPLTDEGLEEIPESIAEIAAPLSRCAYVEAEFFGGNGVQAFAMFSQGRLDGGIAVGKSVINDALRMLGVVAKRGQDEFDTVGLGRERHTDDWTKNQAEPCRGPNGLPPVGHG